MTEIIYASAQTQPFSSAQLTELLAKARRNNQALHVSGLLLYHRGSFLQVLEGDEAVVAGSKIGEKSFENVASGCEALETPSRKPE
jgi:hypothetical protein